MFRKPEAPVHRHVPPRSLVAAVLGLSLLVVAGGCSERHASQTTVRSHEAGALPVFSLQDPHGVEHTSAELLVGGLVLIVSAPILACKDAQEGWSEILVKGSDARIALEVVYLEDLSVSWFPDTARERLKTDFKPLSPPLLLIDEDGALREQLGVPAEATHILVFDETGALRLTWSEDPASDAVAAIAEALGE